MRRIFGFVLGISIGLGVVYAARRWLGLNGTAQSDQGMLATPVAKAPDLATTEAAADPKPAATGRFTVRTNGPRPQIPIVSDTTEAKGLLSDTTETVEASTSEPGSDTTELPKIDTSEPVAAQETDANVVSGRADMETAQELTIADEELPQEMPAPTEAEVTIHDNFATIRGIGEATAQKLHAAGVWSFAQLAALPMEQFEQITEFSEGRIQRDKLIEQAEAEAKGETYNFPEEAVG